MFVRRRDAERLPSEEITGYSWKALLGSAIGYAMDGFDLLIPGFMLHAISADLNLTLHNQVPW